MAVLHPRDRTYPRRIRLHEIAAGDIVRLTFQVPQLGKRQVIGLVSGEPGRQFRRRIRHGKAKYYIDLRRIVGGPPTCIATEIITGVELIAPGPNSLIATE